IEVARRAGAQAVHPGYGFLAENPAFASACAAAGLVFIGPPPEAMQALGSKTSARKIMEAAGVPVVPGTLDAIPTPAEAADLAREIGFPVALKAVSGGGGRGMRVVERPEDVESAFRQASDEAAASFGDPSLYLERLVVRPRHVEIQILADQHGNVVHLGERECSVQRRHQKLVEESPSPAVDAALRAQMGEVAVKAAQAVGYTNAGTCEMLLDQQGNFYFLEVNARLQVEHPITELVTGLDLVAEQIRVAAGRPLSFTQNSVARRGHAIECRINAEDPAGGRFIPSPGTVTALVPPQGPGVRWDGGYEAGDEVSPYYDNLIGKLVVWAPDRPAALARMAAALAEFRLEGVPTTVPAQQAILGHPDFVDARHSTVWLEQRLALPEPSGAGPGDGDGDGGGAGGRSQEVRVAGRWYTIPRPGVESRPPARGRHGGAAGVATASGTVTSQMQGTVVRVLVAVGDVVEAGQGVCAVEAMKMESVLKSGVAGTVAEVKVAPGQPVRAGEALVVIEPQAAGPGSAP
ncbi:MAG TPA: biotin carboxylase N-terminal domain-containing protein, partial [Acidimicrobiia bacterium]|nr:biotin carboxylase N-terminal domain-containing protein [Acidimicrobiia bacterium]